MGRVEVLAEDDGYWGVYEDDYLAYLGDWDTAMMVAREREQQWEAGEDGGIEPDGWSDWEWRVQG